MSGGMTRLLGLTINRYVATAVFKRYEIGSDTRA